MAGIRHYNGYTINKVTCFTVNGAEHYIYKVNIESHNKYIRPFDKLKEAKEWIDTIGIAFVDKTKEQLLEMLFSKFSEYKNRRINHMDFNTEERLQEELRVLYSILYDDISEEDKKMIEHKDD